MTRLGPEWVILAVCCHFIWPWFRLCFAPKRISFSLFIFINDWKRGAMYFSPSFDIQFSYQWNWYDLMSARMSHLGAGTNRCWQGSDFGWCTKQQNIISSSKDAMSLLQRAVLLCLSSCFWALFAISADSFLFMLDFSEAQKATKSILLVFLPLGLLNSLLDFV